MLRSAESLPASSAITRHVANLGCWGHPASQRPLYACPSGLCSRKVNQSVRSQSLRMDFCSSHRQSILSERTPETHQKNPWTVNLAILSCHSAKPPLMLPTVRYCINLLAWIGCLTQWTGLASSTS